MTQKKNCIRLLISMFFVCCLMSNAVFTKDYCNRMDGYTNDTAISASKYSSNLNNYHYIYQLGLAGPGLTAWDYATGEGVNVAVMDNDFNVNHQDLKANIKGCYNAITKKEGADQITNNSSHGTSVAGILAAVGNNNFLSAGVAYNCNLYLIQVDVNGTWQSYEDSIIEGIRYATEKKCRVINLSHGGDTYQENLEAAIDKVYNQQENSILVVASGGNTSKEEYHYPASYSNVLSVSALDYTSSTQTYSIRSNSTYNDHMDIAAPGSGLKTLAYSSNTGSSTGGSSSASAPYVAGVAALIFQADPSLTAKECADIITSTASDAGAKGYDKYYGYGIIQPLAAVQKAIYKTNSKSRVISCDASSYTKTYGAKDFNLNARTTGSGILKYQSSNDKVVSVNSSGNVSIKGTGTAVITISIAKSGIFESSSKQVKITVKSAKASTTTKPKKPVIKSVKKAGKKKIKVTWTKNKQVSGYQICISTTSKFKKQKCVTILKKSKTSKKISGLKKNKKYYIRMRAYVKVNGKKVYSKYSKIKKIKL